MLQKIREYSDTNTHSRRTILTTGAALAGLAATGMAPAGAQSEGELPLSIEINAEDEYITITNDGEESVELTGYSVNFEAPEDDYDQIQPLAGEVVIEAGESIVVPTGTTSEVTSATGTIVELQDPYDTEVLNNEEADDVAILDDEDNVVATTVDSGGDGGETHTLTAIVRWQHTADDSEPAAGLSAEARHVGGGGVAATGTTNEEGVVEFELENGSYSVYVDFDRPEYYDPGEHLVEIDGEDREIQIPLLRHEDDGEIGATLSVDVEDQDGNAVPGIEVVGIGPDAEIYSTDANEDGVATYDFLPAGDYTFHATVDGTDYEESGESEITLEDGDDETLTVTVTDTGANDGDGDGEQDGDDGDDTETPPDESDGEPADGCPKK